MNSKNFIGPTGQIDSCEPCMFIGSPGGRCKWYSYLLHGNGNLRLENRSDPFRVMLPWKHLLKWN